MCNKTAAAQYILLEAVDQALHPAFRTPEMRIRCAFIETASDISFHKSILADGGVAKDILQDDEIVLAAVDTLPELSYNTETGYFTVRR